MAYGDHQGEDPVISDTDLKLILEEFRRPEMNLVVKVTLLVEENGLETHEGDQAILLEDSLDSQTLDEANKNL